VPEPIRELAEKNVAQARATYGQFMDAMAQAIGVWVKAMPTNEVTSSFKTIQERGIRFAKQNGEAGFALASELASAKNIQDMLAIQSRYAQTQIQTFGIQAQQLSWMMADAMRDFHPKSKG